MSVISQPAATGGPKDAAAQKEIHSLALKVMRLSKPSFQISIPVLCEKTDIAGPVILNEKSTNHIEAFGVSDFLTLPHSFGSIYLGETFSCYISINNSSPFDVKTVTVKAELQTASNRFCLLDIGASPIGLFQSGHSHDYVVQQEVKEGGIHILVCTVNYVKHDGEKKYFRKFFKFQVLNPISIKSESHDHQLGIFVITRIQNATQVPLYIETVKFDPIPLFNSTDLNSTPDDSSDPNKNLLTSILGDLVYLKPGDIRQYLFRLDAKNQNDARAKTATAIGKLDIIWKSNLGETGRLQTSPLERKLANQVDLELTVRHIPPHIVLEEPFTIQCELTNRSDRDIKPKITFIKNKTVSIVSNGLSGQQIGNLAPGSTTTVNLVLFPTKPGVQKITAIQVIDENSESKKTYDFNNLTDVFVET